MVLSDVDIRERISAGEIVISPFDEGRLKPASYTLALGSKLLIPRQVAEVDPDKPELDYVTVEMDPSGYLVNPGDFLLGQVAEELSISAGLCCILDARTSLARLGLNVLQGSTLIEPGQHNSHETLEIKNIGPSPIRIRPGLKVVKAVFMTLKTAASSGYSGAYVAQTDPRTRR